MVNSVGEYVAGEEYELDDEVSDRFVALGYAEGDWAGDYDEETQRQLVAMHRESVQEVSLG